MSLNVQAACNSYSIREVCRLNYRRVQVQVRFRDEIFKFVWLHISAKNSVLKLADDLIVALNVAGSQFSNFQIPSFSY